MVSVRILWRIGNLRILFWLFDSQDPKYLAILFSNLIAVCVELRFKFCWNSQIITTWPNGSAGGHEEPPHTSLVRKALSLSWHLRLNHTMRGSTWFSRYGNGNESQGSHFWGAKKEPPWHEKWVLYRCAEGFSFTLFRTLHRVKILCHRFKKGRVWMKTANFPSGFLEKYL